MALIKGTELSEVLVGSSKDSLLNGLEESQRPRSKDTGLLA